MISEGLCISITPFFVNNVVIFYVYTGVTIINKALNLSCEGSRKVS